MTVRASILLLNFIETDVKRSEKRGGRIGGMGEKRGSTEYIVT